MTSSWNITAPTHTLVPLALLDVQQPQCWQEKYTYFLEHSFDHQQFRMTLHRFDTPWENTRQDRARNFAALTVILTAQQTRKPGLCAPVHKVWHTFGHYVFCSCPHPYRNFTTSKMILDCYTVYPVSMSVGYETWPPIGWYYHLWGRLF